MLDTRAKTTMLACHIQLVFCTQLLAISHISSLPSSEEKASSEDFNNFHRKLSASPAFVPEV